MPKEIKIKPNIEKRENKEARLPKSRVTSWHPPVLQCNAIYKTIVHGRRPQYHNAMQECYDAWAINGKCLTISRKFFLLNLRFLADHNHQGLEFLRRRESVLSRVSRSLMAKSIEECWRVNFTTETGLGCWNKLKLTEVCPKRLKPSKGSKNEKNRGEKHQSLKNRAAPRG